MKPEFLAKTLQENKTRKWEDKLQTGGSYLQMTELIKDYYPKYARTLQIQQYEN